MNRIPGVGVPGPAAKHVGLGSNSLARGLRTGQTSLWTESSMQIGATSPVPAASLEQKAEPEYGRARMNQQIQRVQQGPEKLTCLGVTSLTSAASSMSTRSPGMPSTDTAGESNRSSSSVLRRCTPVVLGTLQEAVNIKALGQPPASILPQGGRLQQKPPV